MLIGLVVVGSAFAAGYSFGERSVPVLLPSRVGDSLPPDIDVSPLWKAWRILDEKFISTGTSTKAANNEEKLWGAIGGVAGAYDDPYTAFFPPADKEIFDSQISGNFSGVGMEIGIKDGLLTVIAPLKNTPAERAGIKTGDHILQIDNKATNGLPVDRAVQLIRGPEGSTVSLTILRDGAEEPFEVAITRANIQIPTIDTKLRDDGVFVISLYSFTGNSPDLFRNALREFILSNSDKLIVDLRGNPGGYLEAAVEMASWFLPQGRVVVTEDYGGKEKNIVHRSRGYDVFNENLKMVLLINGGSASASEILAGALSEHGAATLVGEKSFGKGSVQELVDITETTSLKVTVARWLTPQGNSFSERGIEPDVQVAMTAADVEKGVDPQLEKAAELLKQGT